MVKKKYVVKSINGLSSRTSAALVNTANRFKSDLFLIYQDDRANLKSIMSVMALVIQHDEEFKIEVSGEDEKDAILDLEKLMSKQGLI